MSVKNIVYLTDISQITCVVKEGQGEIILKAARELGVSLGARLYHAKGTGARELFGLMSVAIETEKDVVSILVSAEQRDVVFDALYLAGELDVPGMGYMYITQLEKLATYLPENFLNSSEDNNG